MVKYPLFLAIEVAPVRDSNTLDSLQVSIATPGDGSLIPSKGSDTFSNRNALHFLPVHVTTLMLPLLNYVPGARFILHLE